VRITLGANASGLRDSICSRVDKTISMFPGLFRQPWHEQGSEQNTPA
jgi:hypothetical protein